ncbi:NACHT domain- and WD repeat-containing protein 1 [Pleodorina starrii]|nr:NACHT domain- and WD repeat-containing protein 1 [Pleodorina starrii]
MQQRNAGDKLETAAAATIFGPYKDVPAPDTAFPSGIQPSISNSSRAPSAGGPAADQPLTSSRGCRNGDDPPRQQPMSPPPLQHPQVPCGGPDKALDRCLSSGGPPPPSRRSLLSPTRPSGPSAGAVAAQCASPPWPRPSPLSIGAAAAATNTGGSNSGPAAPLRSWSASQGQGLFVGDRAGQGVSSRPSSSRLSAGQDNAAGGVGGGGGGSGLGTVVVGRTSSASGGGEGLASSAGDAAATHLPGSTATDDAEYLAPGGGGAAASGGSLSGSLNPLLARPSGVTHQWPHQQFTSVCSRYSACSASVSTAGGGGGGSFTRQGPPAALSPPLQPPPPAAAARPDSAAGSGSGGRRDVPPLPPPSSAMEPGGGARGRSTVTGTLSYSGSRCPSRVTSAKQSAAARRASSASGCHQGEPYGGGAAAAGTAAAAVTSRASEASDAAAGDTAAASISSGSSSNSSGHSSSGGGSAATGGAATSGTNAEIVDRLLGRFVGREALLRNTYVWLDMFAINQHPDAPGSTQANDLSQLHEVVGRSEQTLLVLDRGGLVLTRIWCLYEIWHTVQRKGAEGLRVLAGPLEFSELAHVWGELDVARAQSTFPSDRDRILASIRSTPGSGELDRAIKQALVKSACLDLDSARDAVPRTPHHGQRAFRAAFLLRTAGSGAAALAAAREAADVFCGCRGPAHADTLRALRTVAGCHKDLGAARQAVGLLEQQVIPYVEEAYGPGSTESGALDELGMLYYTLGQYDTAYDTLLTALCRRLRQLMLAAPTAVAAPQLAAALAAGPCAAALAAAAAAAGRGSATAAAAAAGGSVVPPLEPLSGEHLTAALAAVRALVSELQEAEVAAAQRAALTAAPQGSSGGGGGGGGVVLRGDVGSAVELVGLSLHCVGLVQKERAQRCRSAGSGPLLREARELMEASVELLQLSSGESRGLTSLDSRANLAALAMEGGELAAAEGLLRHNLTMTEAVYGREHPHTATAANNLALCLKRQRCSHPDKAAEALVLYRRCLAVCGRTRGESHPETLVVATNLGVLLADQRQWSESERLLTWAVAALPPQLGERHPDVLAAHRRLAEVMELRNKLFESEAMYRLTLQLAEAGPPEARDHGLVLECREGLTRVQDRMEAAAAAQVSPGCCVVS